MNWKFFIKIEYVVMMFIIAAIVGGILVLAISTLPSCGEIAAEKCMEYCIAQRCICQ